jgi:tight adherence protein B
VSKWRVSRRRAGRSRTKGRDAETEADELAAAVEALAVLLDVGIAPESAWHHVGRRARHAGVGRVAARIVAGATVLDALAAEVRSSGQATAGASLGPLSAAWEVATRAGTPLGPVLRGTAAAMRDRADVLREVEIALSGPRSTARLVGWLPVVGLGFALLVGVDPVGALAATPLGVVLLGSGAVLGVAGRVWTRSQVRRASPAASVAGLGEELLVIALGSGLSVSGAMALVGDTCTRLRLPPPDERSIGEVLELAERAGAPAAQLLASAADQRRRVARADGRRDAAELGVRLLLPLALCVLPSFLLLGVAPVVLGLISSTVAGFG